MIERVELDGETVTVIIDGESLRFTGRWLRDHSEDPTSLEPRTLQREVDTFMIPASLAPVSAVVADGALVLGWDDGIADSVCSEHLLRSVVGSSTDARRAWGAPATMGAERRPCRQLLTDDDMLAGLLDDLAVWGVALIEGMAPTEGAASELATRIGRVRTTTFGGMWKLESSMTEHQDSAYATTFLEPHTDATYMVDAPGSQLFCCVRRTGTGGESILVDGLAIAESLRVEEPEAFDTLTTVEVSGRYVEPGVHLRATRPAIRLDAHGRFEQLSFNNYDRAPFWLPEPEMTAFYDAYAALHGRIVEAARWFEVRLEAGEALIFDNWRVLHGRQAYIGDRTFFGCYHDREELDSRRRVLSDR